MLNIRRLVVGQLNSNCYIVSDESDDDCIIIDPGDEADYISEIIQKNNFSPKFIIATHGHFDHISAVNELKMNFSIPFVMSKKDEFLLSRMRQSSIRFTGVDPGPAPKVDLFTSNEITTREVISKLGVKCKLSLMTLLKTPGHTPGSICLYSKSENALFCGDLIFEGGGVGRYDFSYSDKDSLFKSIKNVLRLDKEKTIYPGHGNKFSIGKYKYAFS